MILLMVTLSSIICSFTSLAYYFPDKHDKLDNNGCTLHFYNSEDADEDGIIWEHAKTRGWIEYNGDWYYLGGGDGYAYRGSITPDGYWIGDDCRWVESRGKIPDLEKTPYCDDLINAHKIADEIDAPLYGMSIKFTKEDLVEHDYYYEIKNQVIPYERIPGYDIGFKTYENKFETDKDNHIIDSTWRQEISYHFFKDEIRSRNHYEGSIYILKDAGVGMQLDYTFGTVVKMEDETITSKPNDRIAWCVNGTYVIQLGLKDVTKDGYFYTCRPIVMLPIIQKEKYEYYFLDN